jgi:2-hydroxy-3-keto-5-methylthiopentenyl-1-phosphate phosphatase
VGYTICIDFDDTIVERDIAAQLLDQFAHSSWRELREQFGRRELTLEQYSAAALDLVDATPEELVAFALDVARPRAGLLELADWAQWNGWHVAVVSSGWDVYINPILDSLGAERLPRHCGRARFTYRWRLQYLSARGIELTDGFKLSYASAFREAGDTLVWVGDGRSDVTSAALSDSVFARSVLLEELATARDRVFPFETFHDVVAVLEREAAGWSSEAEEVQVRDS